MTHNLQLHIQPVLPLEHGKENYGRCCDILAYHLVLPLFVNYYEWLLLFRIMGWIHLPLGEYLLQLTICFFPFSNALLFHQQPKP